MKHVTVLYRLRMRGTSLSKIAAEMGVSRQLARYAIWVDPPPKRGSAKKVREKIMQLIAGQEESCVEREAGGL